MKRNWDYYKEQLPASYNNSYRYEDVRYTNWDKIPVILPALKKILTIFLGKERTDTISLRVHLLRIYDLYFLITLFLYIPISILTVRKIVQKNLLSVRYTSKHA